ncbi:secreted protein containing PEP-CTERM bacterial domain protein [Rhodopirellula baltica SH28]|uniref:Secreted protein containing PEP-CTERM bacterial domain protein n=1 Tax=Rhodopirellula baltica SH28 TaxID=993517 RepID=K5DCZ4_RHOBT|nr:PEP-CTERM sorting domain-containing protein [Rhodopirellula baltica]EKK00704.1 secreted protein containing PEP-CTERM bacterial domain protein [Rhodopirellula baltica SH28]
MRTIFLLALLTIITASTKTGNAAVVAELFELDVTIVTLNDTSVNALTYVRTLTSSDGVSFDATITVTGNGSNVQNSSNGLGVNGTTLSDGETLTFAMSISNVVGGTAVFDGFTLLDFNSFTDTRVDTNSLTYEEAIFTPGGLVTPGQAGFGTFDVFDLTQLNLGAPLQDFTLAAVTDSTARSFQLDDITAQFTTDVTAVPEPSSFALVAIGSTVLTVVRRRKQTIRRDRSLE